MGICKWTCDSSPSKGSRQVFHGCKSYKKALSTIVLTVHPSERLFLQERKLSEREAFLTVKEKDLNGTGKEKVKGT